MISFDQVIIRFNGRKVERNDFKIKNQPYLHETNDGFSLHPLNEFVFEQPVGHLRNEINGKPFTAICYNLREGELVPVMILEHCVIHDVNEGTYRKGRVFVEEEF